MRPLLSRFAFLLFLLPFLSFQGRIPLEKRALFDGMTFQGWEGDTTKTWRIVDGMLVGGSLEETVPHNDFLVTDREYGDFILTLKIRLRGQEGFINSGIQFHSQRLADPAYEMTGYQADWGEGYWASLYDESRRNKTLIAPDSTQVLKWIKKGEWNDYKIHAEKGRIQLFINGHQTVDYKEPDSMIPQSGLISLQIHGGGKAEVAIKDIFIEELNQKNR
ncbi:DUF1080 domain-containing protein [Algoriphagus aestuariicola]|uniref:DUF1080 domain-containing protein n=1 Tax=Algoriphagus aestuariicola TaxID=1852016 RepID=A0ABS3BPE8_9BACT|nr:DUF1080 domain-containing protein [Algoriphagus aestuariicola]MBN7800205.1 DUF1080 domain-containing protein [Algoriphagus aestuariicola]